eukprot:Colp12_sorted_trinity150504_noHs@351
MTRFKNIQAKTLPGILYSSVASIAFIAGNLSYREKCFERILALPNSELANMIRENKQESGLLDANLWKLEDHQYDRVMNQHIEEQAAHMHEEAQPHVSHGEHEGAREQHAAEWHPTSTKADDLQTHSTAFLSHDENDDYPYSSPWDDDVDEEHKFDSERQRGPRTVKYATLRQEYLKKVADKLAPTSAPGVHAHSLVHSKQHPSNFEHDENSHQPEPEPEHK